MGEIYIVLLCHAEPEWWFPERWRHYERDAKWEAFELGIPTMMEIAHQVEAQIHKPIKFTFCLTRPVAEGYRDAFKELESKGHEIGLHSHFMNTWTFCDTAAKRRRTER